MQTLRLALILFLVCPIQVFAKNIEKNSEQRPPIVGLSTHVINGSTFIAMGQTIKLWGIEVPAETDPHYLAAKLYLKTILEESSHSCYYKAKNKHQEYVMQCFSQGQDIASMLVRMGVARDFYAESNGAYKADEAFAREQRYGIWRMP